MFQARPKAAIKMIQWRNTKHDNQSIEREHNPRATLTTRFAFACSGTRRSMD